MIISVHLPKAAGTSFGAALAARFGDRLLRDYDDFPINTPVPERHRSAVQQCLRNEERDFSGVECIHGHFLPVKYLLAAERHGARFVTWLREPVARMLSHYHFWKRTYDPRVSATLHRRAVEEDWSLERFCLGPELRNLYAQFLWGFPLAYFDFVGITEFFEEDLPFFAGRYLGQAAASRRLNAASGEGTDIEAGLRRRIEAFHDADMALYQRAVAARTARRSAE